MWWDDPVAFAKRHHITEGQANLLKVSAEHLQARSDGGADCLSNIVAACTYCNRHSARIPLAPAAFGRYVRARLAAGRWHRLRLI
jgi:hypothetical protein